MSDGEPGPQHIYMPGLETPSQRAQQSRRVPLLQAGLTPASVACSRGTFKLEKQRKRERKGMQRGTGG